MQNIIHSVVTGANGFVGSHLTDHLLSKGHHVKCIVRKSSDLKWLEGKSAEIIKCGLDDRKVLAEVLAGADYLFHVAGVVKSKTREGYFRGNVETTRNLLEVCAGINPEIKRIVIVSSQTASGPSLNKVPVDETTPPNPITTYGQSKLAQEELARGFMDRLRITICRPPAVYGERDTEILIFFKTFYKGLMTTIGLRDKVLSLVHVQDLAEGIFLAASSDIAVGQTYFIVSQL